MQAKTTSASEYDQFGNWQPCGPDCACNSLTLVCWGRIESEPCHFCGEPCADDVYSEDGYPDAPCCSDEDACHARKIARGL